MGLDNGIIVKVKNTDLEREICYWRKHIRLRSELFSQISLKNCSETILSYKDVKQVIKILFADTISFGKKFPHDFFDFSLWRNIKRIVRLCKTLLMMKYRTDIEVIFYDSY